MRSGGILWWILFPALLFLNFGCVANEKAAKPTTPASDWKTIGGQVRYADSKRSFVADVTIRQGNTAREYSLDVNKAGAILLKLDRAESIGWAKGPLAYGMYHGLVEAAPQNLQKWYLETTAALEKKPTNPASGIQYRLQQ